MYDVSNFMKEIKQRFSQGYNARNERVGTLWEGRFKSVLVENNREALIKYGGLYRPQPGASRDRRESEDYRWCGYGRAVGGDKSARQGLGLLLDNAPEVCGENFESDWEETSKLYRLWLHHEGQEILPDNDKGQKGRKGFTQADLEAVEQLQGKMPRGCDYPLPGSILHRWCCPWRQSFIERVFKETEKIRTQQKLRLPPNARS